jgi:phage gp36-like protein
MYSTKQSVIDSFGEKNILALMRGQDTQIESIRLTRAAKTAAALLDSKLNSAGIKLPLVFSPYNAELLPTDPAPLNPLIQQASDCFTVYYMAFSLSLMTKEFQDCYKMWLDWFDDLISGKEKIDLEKTASNSSDGDFVVLSRPSIIENASNGYPGCCGKRWY